MTLNQEIYDLLEIAQRFGINIDSLLEEDYIAHKIHNYRETEIIAEYRQTGSINSEWLSDLGNTDTTKVNSSDDILITSCNCSFSKITLPPVIPLVDFQSGKNNLGVYRLATVCGKYSFNEIAMSTLKEIPSGHIRNKFKHYVKIGTAFYLTPVVDKVRPIVVLANPMEGFVLQTENIASGSLIVGTSYMAVNKQVVHNGIGYAPGATFVAVNTLFTGLGQVQYASQKRTMTEYDEYPCSRDMMNKIILKILVDDFRLSNEQIADVRQDGTDQRLLQGATK